MMEELVSVIVPIYNVEQYLRECVDSILNNTYRNLEVILVDDGSPDHCGEICDEYAEKDSRITVIHQENKGLVGARNAGLKIATGEYVSFIDSDDAVSSCFYEIMVHEIKRENADMAACEVTRQLDMLQQADGREERRFCTVKQDEMMALVTSAPSMRSVSWTSCFTCNKLYRRNRILKEYNPERLMCEDLGFNYDFIESCRKMVTFSARLYFYRLNEASICGTYRSHYEHKLLYGIRNAEFWVEISNHPWNSAELKNYLSARAAYMGHGALWRIYVLQKQQDYPEKVEQIGSFIRNHFREVWADKQTYSVRIRLIMAAYCFCSPVWRLAASLAGRRG